jgi:hypothetical protein
MGDACSIVTGHFEDAVQRGRVPRARLVLGDPIYEDREFYRWMFDQALPRLLLEWRSNLMLFQSGHELSGCLQGIAAPVRVATVVQQTGGNLAGDFVAKCYHLLIGGSRRTLHGKFPDGWVSNTWPQDYSVATQHKWTKNPLYIGLVLRHFTDPGDLVVDPCAGRGLIGYVAMRMGRRYVGLEREAETAEAARTVLNVASLQPRLELEEARPLAFGKET